MLVRIKTFSNFLVSSSVVCWNTFKCMTGKLCCQYICHTCNVQTSRVSIPYDIQLLFPQPEPIPYSLLFCVMFHICIMMYYILPLYFVNCIIVQIFTTFHIFLSSSEEFRLSWFIPLLFCRRWRSRCTTSTSIDA